jgi:tRNA threonylcarbamoyladenosine biosynthesis protein TsaE
MAPPMTSRELALELHNRGDTRRLGHRLAECLSPGDLVLLEGPLGAGKTFLARAIARGLGVPTSIRVTSPTFDLVHELPARLPLLHVDLYRLDTSRGLRDLGLEERIGHDAVALVEWGERFAQELGWQGLVLSIRGSEDTRRCRGHAIGPRGEQLLSRLTTALDERGIHGSSCPA